MINIYRSGTRIRIIWQESTKQEEVSPSGGSVPPSGGSVPRIRWFCAPLPVVLCPPSGGSVPRPLGRVAI